MSVALEAAQWAGVSVAGVGALLAALYGRKAMHALAKLGTVATFGLFALVVVGVGALLGWWNINVGTIADHGSVLADGLGWGLDALLDLLLDGGGSA